MAQPGSTFDKKYPWHSDLAGLPQPLKMKITGAKRYRETEATTYFVKFEGDTEGEYGIKSETPDDSYDKALAAIPRNTMVEATFEGNGQQGEGTVSVEVPEGAVVEPEPERPAQGRSTGGSTPRPAGMPWGSMEERYGQALRAAVRIIPEDVKHTVEDIRSIAATLMIGQTDLFRQVGIWLPLEAAAQPAAPEPDMATAEELAGLKAAFDPIAFHVPEKERTAMEGLIRDGAPLERVVAARGFLAAVAERVRMKAEQAEADAANQSKQQETPPPAEPPAEEQDSLPMIGASMGAEDDLPF